MPIHCFLLVLIASIAASLAAAEERVVKLADGTVEVRPLPVPNELRNEWPAELEREFQARVQQSLKATRAKNPPGKYGGTYFESEKQSYPAAMFDFLNGNREPALKFLQGDDASPADQAHTLGIDLYPCFTLKGQIRKYFFFGQYLDPQYKQRMFDAAKIFTAKDPLTQKHPRYPEPKRGAGYNADATGLWVDNRNTDNLRAMRDVAVYLFAEETGNEETRKLYKERLRKVVTTLYHIGEGEWDSENYHGHALASYLSLYDYAKDRDTQALAKAALDWLSAAAAVKYYRGGWGGPTKRDYGGANRVYGSGAARTADLWFGDCPLPDEDPERDHIHLITSAYRPPAAVVALARKDFERPIELRNTKPTYDTWLPGNDKLPQYWETVYFGQTFQMGSVVSKTAVNDVGPFKLQAFNSQRGVDYFVANSQSVLGHQGKHAGDQIAQYRNLLIWLRPVKDEAADKGQFYFLTPKSAKARIGEGLHTFEMEKSVVALAAINLGRPEVEPITTKKKEGKNGEEKTVPDERFAADLLYKAPIRGGKYAGFAIEVTDGTPSKTKLDIHDEMITLTATDGHTLKLTHNKNSDLPIVECDGKLRDWEKELDLYKPSEDSGPIRLGWKEGTLRVQAGGKVFESTVTADGKPSSSERTAK